MTIFGSRRVIWNSPIDSIEPKILPVCILMYQFPWKCTQSCGREEAEMINGSCVHVTAVQQLWGCCPRHHPDFSQHLILQ